MSDLRLPLWALAEATARISEIPNVRVRDLDIAGEVVFWQVAPEPTPGGLR
jgi:hypothetical protein